MSGQFISVRESLPKIGQTVIAHYAGVYDYRLVVFWMDYELTPHFGRPNEPDGKGSQPATHWAQPPELPKNDR